MNNKASKTVQHIPRPPNPFMCFRMERGRELRETHESTIKEAKISTILSREWHLMPPAEKDHWRAVAAEAKIEHKRKYPNYKYQPRKKKTRQGLTSDSAKSPGSSSEAFSEGDPSPLLAMENGAFDTNALALAMTRTRYIDPIESTSAQGQDAASPVNRPWRWVWLIVR